jgi:UDP-N-acetylmuramyl pentapeptide synthase
MRSGGKPAHLEKIDMTGALSRLAALKPITSRMNVVTLQNGVRIIDDSCKASIESIQAALDALSRMPAERKVVVLGNVEEPPGKQRDVYRELGRRLGCAANVAICIGSDSMTSLLEKIKLRDTVGLEIAGFAVAVLVCMGAISFLNPDSDWHADALRAARHPWPWRR